MADSKKPTLHHLNKSQSQRILWLLEELEIPYDLNLYERHASGPKQERAPDELKLVHPLGKSPTLVTADGRVLTESNAIAKYLIETYDKTGKFQGSASAPASLAATDSPASSGTRIYDSIRDETLSSFANASLSVVVVTELLATVMVLRSPFLLRPIFSGTRSMIRKMYTASEFDAAFKYLQDELGDEDYFMGKHPGRADFMLLWPMDNCKQREFVDFTRYSKINAWYERCHARPAWKRALEKGNGYTLNFE